MPSDSGDRRPKPSPLGCAPQEVHEQQLPCPRCDSTNTKFCYYNNYNLSQPRHFCKSCRRYWTQGGTLRNVPIGGGTRKNSKRSRTTTPTATAASPCSSSSVSTSHEPMPAAPISSSSPSPTDLLFPLRHDLVDLNAVSGGGLGFTSLLHSHTTPGFLALGGFGLGIGVPSFDELGLGFDMGRGVWPSLGEITDGGGHGGVITGGGATWQFGNNVGGGGGGGDGATFCETEGFAWPELAISSTPRKGVK